MLTQPEKEYVKRLLQAQPSLTNEDLDTLIEKRRENESQGKSNRAPQKWILGAMEKFNQFVNTNPIARESKNVWAGAIQAGGEVSAWLLGQLSRLAPGNQSADQSSFYNQTQRLLGNTKQDMQSEGINTEWLAYWAGKGIMNIAAGSVWAGLIGKGIQAGTKLGAVANLGTKIATKSPTLAKYGNPIIQGFTWAATKGNLAQKVIWGAATGAREWLWFDLASANTPWAGTVWGAVIGGALPIVWAGLKATWNYLSRTLPWNLQLQGLMNPAKVTMLKKQLQTEWVTSPQDVGKWMLDRGIKWNKETIINTLISRAEKSKQAVDDSLSAIKKTVFSPVAKKALQQTYDDMAKVAGLEDDAAKVLKLLKKDKYTLSELNWVKRILDDQYNLFTKTGDPTAWLKAKWLQTIRQQLRKTIEEVASEAGVKNIRALNNETQIARTMADAIARKDSADAVREALTAFAPTWVGGIIGGVAWPFDNSTIEGKVWNVLLGVLAGKALGSTTLKTNIASLLNKLSKQEIGALDAYLRSGGKTALTPKIIQTMDDTLKLLPPASWKPVSASVVDVKPMTGFSPGRMQAQQQAIGSKVWTQPLTTATQQNPWVSGVTPLSSTQWVQQKILPKVPWEKVIPPIIPKSQPKAKLRTNEDALKKPDDWTKKDFTKTTESKSVDKYWNTIAREQGKTSAVDSITVGGKKYTNLDIPDSSRTLYALDWKIYEYKNGKMVLEWAKPESKLPKTPQEGKTATEAMKNKYNITDEAYLDYTPKELMNISEKMTDFKDIKWDYEMYIWGKAIRTEAKMNALRAESTKFRDMAFDLANWDQNSTNTARKIFESTSSKNTQK